MGTENQAVRTANLADFTHSLFSVIQRPFLDERSESGNGLYLWRVNVCHFPLLPPLEPVQPVRAVEKRGEI